MIVSVRSCRDCRRGRFTSPNTLLKNWCPRCMQCLVGDRDCCGYCLLSLLTLHTPQVQPLTPVLFHCERQWCVLVLNVRCAFIRIPYSGASAWISYTFPRKREEPTRADRQPGHVQPRGGCGQQYGVGNLEVRHSFLRRAHCRLVRNSNSN